MEAGGSIGKFAIVIHDQQKALLQLHRGTWEAILLDDLARQCDVVL